MTKLKTITKGLLGASAISLFAATNAFAAGTAAGTNVENTFTLNYNVSGTPQTQIDNTGSPTEFTVDRLVDLTVASSGDTSVAPGALDQELVFTVTNNGNDEQAYSFVLVNETGDIFNTGGFNITYYLDNGTGGVCDATDLAGTPNPYTPGSGLASIDILADGVFCVVVDGDIPTESAPSVPLVDTNTSLISLLADTLEPGAPGVAGTVVIADAGVNTLTGPAENVLADGTGSTAADLDFQGDHSASGSYIVASADLTAAKAVSIFTQDGSGCSVFPGAPGGGDQYSVPGACVEYVITVENTGASASATGIVIADILPDSLTFINATPSGFGGGTFNQPTPSTSCDGTAGTCEVELDGATLGAGVTGTITIRALIK
ncbi:MAG: DUF11 domain-containing protein [Robiginitomaculum sp.]|nr:DUF11 domain-containing protein [Robiginitomaculum sp.]